MTTRATPDASRPAVDGPAVDTPGVPQPSAAPDGAAGSPGDRQRRALERLFRRYPAPPAGQVLRDAVSTYRRRSPP